jgi:hypothetical protein
LNPWLIGAGLVALLALASGAKPRTTAAPALAAPALATGPSFDAELHAAYSYALAHETNPARLSEFSSALIAYGWVAQGQTLQNKGLLAAQPMPSASTGTLVDWVNHYTLGGGHYGGQVAITDVTIAASTAIQKETNPTNLQNFGAVVAQASTSPGQVLGGDASSLSAISNALMAQSLELRAKATAHLVAHAAHRRTA